MVDITTCEFVYIGFEYFKFVASLKQILRKDRQERGEISMFKITVDSVRKNILFRVRKIFVEGESIFKLTFSTAVTL